MLTGNVAINDHEIATWTAIRQNAQFGNDADAVNPYDVVVKYQGRDGYNYRAEFTAYHTFGHGALALAGKVLQGANTYLRRDHREL